MSRIFFSSEAAQRPEGYDFVQPIDEFRSKLAPCRVHTSASHLSIQLLVHLPALGLPRRFRRIEAQPRIGERTHFRRAQIAGHEDQRAGEIHFAIVAQRQRALVQDAQQQVPQRVAGLLDLIKKNKA